jgi:hypothetical protein
MTTPDYTDPQTAAQARHDDFATAVAAITRAVTAANAGHGPDGAEFIAHVLATVAANLGSTNQLTAARPGSWEAAGVQDLVHKTAGWNDEYLMTFRTAPIEVVVNTENELDDLGLFMTYEASADHIGQHLFGDRYAAGVFGRHVWVGHELQPELAIERDRPVEVGDGDVDGLDRRIHHLLLW